MLGLIKLAAEALLSTPAVQEFLWNAAKEGGKQLITNPKVQELAIDAAKSALMQATIQYGPSVLSAAGDGVYNIVEFVSSTRVSITKRTKEGEIVLEATEQIALKRYSAKNINSSTVIQGEHIIGGISFAISMPILLIPQLKSAVHHLHTINSNLNELQNITVLRELERETNIYGAKVADILSKAMDYPKLQRALGTN